MLSLVIFPMFNSFARSVAEYMPALSRLKFVDSTPASLVTFASPVACLPSPRKEPFSAMLPSRSSSSGVFSPSVAVVYNDDMKSGVAVSEERLMLYSGSFCESFFNHPDILVSNFLSVEEICRLFIFTSCAVPLNFMLKLSGCPKCAKRGSMDVKSAAESLSLLSSPLNVGCLWLPSSGNVILKASDIMLL